MRFLRTIRLDESDTHVFENPCVPGEWAVSGSFVFLHDDPETINGKRELAFRSGFLGTETFGWSTLVEIVEITEDEYQRVVDQLARRFMDHYGAPHLAAALPVAQQEADYSADIDEFKLHTLLSIEREFGDDGIVERLRAVSPSAADHANVKIWTIEDGP